MLGNSSCKENCQTPKPPITSLAGGPLWLPIVPAGGRHRSKNRSSTFALAPLPALCCTGGPPQTLPQCYTGVPLRTLPLCYTGGSQILPLCCTGGLQTLPQCYIGGPLQSLPLCYTGGLLSHCYIEGNPQQHCCTADWCPPSQCCTGGLYWQLSCTEPLY